MADRNRTLTITINANTSKAVSSINGLKTALGQMVQAGSKGGLEALAKQAEAAIVSTAAASNKAAEATSKASAATKIGSVSFAQYNVAAAQAAIGLRTYAASIEMQARGTRYYTDSTDAASRATSTMASTAASAAPAVSKLTNIYQQGNGFQQQWSSTTRAATPILKGYAEAATQAAANGTALAQSVQRGIAPVQQATARFLQYDAGVRMWSDTTRAANPVFSELTTRMDNAGGAIGRLGASLTQMTDQMDRNRRTAYAMTIAGLQLVAFGRAIQSSLKGATDELGKFDFAMRRAAGAMNIMDDTSAMFGGLRDEIVGVAQEVKLFGSEEIAKGMYYWASTTGQVVKNQQDLKNVMEQVIPIMRSAAMTETSLEQSLKGVIGITNQFNLGIDKAADTVTKLQYVANKTATEFPDLLESLKMMGPIAATFGVSLEDVLKTLSILGNLGIKGSMAGRALAMMFSKIAEPTDAATAALDKFAAKAGKVGTFAELVFPQGQFIGIQGFLNLLTDLTNNLTMAERTQLMALITTQNEWRALQPLVDANARSMRETGRSILETADDLKGAAGVVADQWELMANSINATFGQVARHIEPMMYAIGDAVAKVFKAISPVIIGIADTVTALAKANPELFTFVVGMIAIAGAAATAVGSLLMFVGAFKLLTAVAFPELLLEFLRVGFPKQMALAGVETAATTQKVSLLGQAFSKILGPISRAIKTIISGLGEMVASMAGSLARGAQALVAAGTSAMQALAAKMPMFGAMSAAAWTTAFQLALAGAALVATVLIVWNVYEGEKAKIKAQGEELAKQTAEYVKEASDRELLKAYEGVKAQYEKMSYSLINTTMGMQRVKNKGMFGEVEIVKGVMDQLAAEIDARGPMVRRALDKIWEYETEEPKADRWKAMAAARINAIHSAVKDQAAAMSGEIAKSIEMMFSGSVSTQRMGQEAVRGYVWGMRDSIGTEVKPAIENLYNMAVEMMGSSDAKVRAAGNRTMIALAEAIKSGDKDKVQTAFKSVIATANQLISSTSPAMRKHGYKMLAEIGQGLRQNKALDAATKVQLYNAILLLQSGNAAFQTAGANIILTYVNGMIGQEQKVIDEAKRIRGLAARTLAGTGAINIDKQEEEVAKKLGLAAKPFDLAKLLGFTTEDQETKAAPGGGGGGGGTEKSPLEKALEVAKGAAELAEALKKTEGLNIKAMVKTSMKSLAEAMLLADKITYQVTKSFGSKKVKEVAEFADASQKVAAMIGSAVEAFGKMENLKIPAAAVFKSVAIMVANIVTYVSNASKKIKTEAVAAAVVFSEQAAKVVELMGGALDLFSKITDEMPEMPKDEFWAALVALIADLTTKVGIASTQVKVELAKSAKEFADNASSVMTLIGGALEAFSKNTDIEALSEQTIKTLVENIKTSITAINGLATEMNLDPKALQKIGDFSKTAADIVSAIKTTAQAFEPIKRDIIDPEKEEWITVGIPEQIERMKQGLDVIKGLLDSYDFSLSTLKKMEMMAGVAEKIGSTVKQFFDMAQPIKADKEGQEGAVQFANLGQVVSDVLGGIFTSMMNFVNQFDKAGSDMMSNLVNGLRAQEGNLAMAVAEINAILAGVGGTSVVTFTVATTVAPTVIEHRIVGDVGELTAEQIADIINSGTQMATNVTQSARTA